MYKVFLPLLISAGVISFIGCQPRSADLPEKPPRPVTVVELVESAPISRFVAPGSVKSWKTEQIGFEVSGRVEWVLEPGENILGRTENVIAQTLDIDGKVITEGTPLGMIDPAKYEVAVASAEAALDVAKLEKDVLQLRIDDAIPADIDSAEGDLALAQDEFDRIENLKSQNAVSQSEYDEAFNRLQTQKSRLANLNSSLSQAEVELKAAEARVLSAQESLKDANRDLENTELYASFPGQISEALVVPGSVVDVGEPVLTLQMMRPIKVEVEVSADQSREIQRRRQLPISFVAQDGEPRNLNAFLYIVDPAADTATRTFTATLLVMNEEFRPPLPEHLQELPLAKTEDVWPLRLNEVIGAPLDTFFVEYASIADVDSDPYVWQVINVGLGATMPDILEVRRRPVKLLDQRISFFGNWEFQKVEFIDDDTTADAPPVGPLTLISGTLQFPDNDPTKWDGKSVAVTAGLQWMLRPGDLVNVHLDGRENQPGYYVPVETVYQESGATYVFVNDNNVARKTRVETIIPEQLKTGALIQILPYGSSQFPDGMKIVVGGVHFLKDGDRINVVSELEMPQLADGVEGDFQSTSTPIEIPSVGIDGDAGGTQ